MERLMPWPYFNLAYLCISHYLVGSFADELWGSLPKSEYFQIEQAITSRIILEGVGLKSRTRQGAKVYN